MVGLDRNEKTVIVFEDGLKGDRELSSAIEATLRHATQAYRVDVVSSEAALSECLVLSQPVLLIIDADRHDALSFERLVAGLRVGTSTRWLPVLAMTAPGNLPVLQEAVRLGLVDFILKPFEPDELWARVRVGLHQAAVVADLERHNSDLARKSMTDALTGLYNTGYVVERCEQEISRAKRYGHPVSCLLVDIDRFKDVNDTYGHPAGNEVLAGLARLLRSSVRGSDAVGRYGGEEFLLVLPETDRAGAVILAERLRQSIERTSFRAGLTEVRITVSVGVATYPDQGILGRETLFMAVDRAAYRAKTLGRNRVACLADQEDSAQQEEEGAVGGD